ncbi:homoserine O-acetyltransferase MetX [Caulifigura coniformis]|nr:homoserine O-acetyltransferase [Caulifigura coniformis]
MSSAAATPVQPESGEPNGYVQRQSATLFEPPRPLLLKCGQEFGPITVAYQTYGELSPRKDNAVFICHALTGDSHVAGRRHPEDRKPGWWDGFVGPGKGIDTDRFFVICANVLGGCQGTTGPNSTDPAVGKPYGPEFPFLTVSDIVRTHQALVASLGISKLLAIVGGSLGGMQVLEWAAHAPDSIASAIVLASGARLSAQGIAFNAVGRRAIVADPAFNGGNFYEQADRPKFGLALARMIAHITYLSEQAIERKFGRRLQHTEELRYQINDDTEFQIESYLNYQGKRFVERFDANSYLRLTRAMDYFDLERDYGPMSQSLAKTAARFLVVSYNTDWLFPTEQSRAIVRALVQAGRHVSYTELNSPHGHDAFLVESELPMLAKLVAPFLDRCYFDLPKGAARA